MTETAATNEEPRWSKATSSPKVGRPPATSGKDKVADRLEREAVARRAAFATALAGFVFLFGLIAIGGKPAPATSQEQPPRLGNATRAGRVIAEIPIAGLTDNSTQTIIRLVAPESQGPSPQVRTRAS
jgi:hypothetical protein